MKEQIKEIARGICGLNTSDGCFCDGGYCNYNCLAYEKAEALYNAGYRKQSEGEWKQTEEPMGWHDVDCVECSACGESWVLNDNLDFDLTVEYWHYCPNCGAKMKGGAE